MDRHDARMIELSRDLSFFEKTRQDVCRGLGRQFRWRFRNRLFGDDDHCGYRTYSVAPSSREPTIAREQKRASALRFSDFSYFGGEGPAARTARQLSSVVPDTDSNSENPFVQEVASPDCSSRFSLGAAVSHPERHLCDLASTATRGRLSSRCQFNS